MEIRKRFFKNIAVLYITGNINIDSAEIIEETGHLVKEGVEKILCNFANVDVVDYNGLSILAIAYKNVVNQNGALKFCGVQPHIKELLKAARLDTVFETYDDEEDALKSFDFSTKVDNLQLRRRFKRIDMGLPVKFKNSISSGIKLSKGKALNLGAEGLFIYAKDTYPLSTALYMEIDLASAKKTLTLVGDVMWLADKELQPHSFPGMGIRFANIDKKTQEEIIGYIDRHITGRTKT